MHCRLCFPYVSVYPLTRLHMLRSIKYDLAIALPALTLASLLGAFTIAHS
jgi:hypothetical protein